MSNVYSSIQSPDFSGGVISESTLDDVNKLEIYRLKEKLRVRDPKSILPDLEDNDFLRDLQLTKFDGNVERLTVAGLLFVGKEASLQRMLPQAEVIYLHYSANNLEEYDARLDLKTSLINIIDKLTERVQTYGKIENVQIGLFRLEIEEFPERVFQEALLNALSHRDYQSNAAIYVKQYPDRIVIENPGGFLDGITENNIITHPSVPRNKLIAETLQNLKYVQRTGQGVDIMFKDMVSLGKPYPRYKSFNDAVSLTMYNAIDNTEFVKFIVETQEKNSEIMSLAEMMILRDLMDNRKQSLSVLSNTVQKSLDETKKICNKLIANGLIEIVGKEYMLTAKVYEVLKSDIEYTRDKTIQYIKAKNMIIDYLEMESNDKITSAKIQEMCGFTKQQARSTIDKMRKEGILDICKHGKYSYYVKI
ncbi:MAG: ATP-binding protein [Bacillota bacterium]|nr:ATP-binding protein [Bacillota bacterium]